MIKYFITLHIFFIFYFSCTGQISDYYPETSLPCEIVKHTYFTLCYSEDDEQALWLVYLLTRNMVETNVCARIDNFKADPFVSSGSASPADYKNSGYDRGHLCPAADMNFNCEAMKESFLMSNMSPQLPGFNRGIWKKLEDKIRDWALLYDSIYIITAGVLELPCTGHIGTNNVSIPKYYYKAVYRKDNKGGTCIVFLLPNESSNKELDDFVITTDSLESVSRLNFFSLLPDSIQKVIEAKTNIRDWE